MADLYMWVVTDGASDVDDRYAAREWRITRDGVQQVTGNIVTSDNLDLLRRFFSRRGLVSVERSPEDDPVIVEVWL